MAETDNREQAEHATEYTLAVVNAQLKAQNTALAARVAELKYALQTVAAIASDYDADQEMSPEDVADILGTARDTLAQGENDAKV